MSRTSAISAFDTVELIEPVDEAPAGARGGVLEMTDPGTAMVEVLSPEIGAVERILFAPLTSLRRVA
jgi:hypothetical protein